MTAKDSIEEFQDFLDAEVNPATAELTKLTDLNRVHVQRLVYTNAVDRFDHLLDSLLLSAVTMPAVRDGLLKDMDEPLTEANLLRYVLAEEGQVSYALGRLQDKLRSSTLRERHSKKLRLVCNAIIPNEDIAKPRTNPATGQVLSHIKGSQRVPLSIVGYADWLYCRRSAIVHGGGKRQISDRDFEHLKTYHGIKKLTRAVKLKLSSIKTALRFYEDVSTLFADSPLLPAGLEVAPEKKPT